MPLIPKYETDEYGHLLCPLCQPWPHNDGSSVRGLYVVWEQSCPVATDTGRITRKDVHGWAVTSSWRVECINGHVVATSANEDGAGDDAEPFWLDALPVMHHGTEIVDEPAA